MINHEDTVLGLHFVKGSASPDLVWPSLMWSAERLILLLMTLSTVYATGAGNNRPRSDYRTPVDSFPVRNITESKGQLPLTRRTGAM